MDDALAAKTAAAVAMVIDVPTAASNAAAVLSAAQASPIHANTKLQNGAPVIGDGTPANKWRGA